MYFYEHVNIIHIGVVSDNTYNTNNNNHLYCSCEFLPKVFNTNKIKWPISRQLLFNFLIIKGCQKPSLPIYWAVKYLFVGSRLKSSRLMFILDSISIPGSLLSYLGGMISSSTNINIWMDCTMWSLYLLDPNMVNILSGRYVFFRAFQQRYNWGSSQVFVWTTCNYSIGHIGRTATAW